MNRKAQSAKSMGTLPIDLLNVFVVTMFLVGLSALFLTIQATELNIPFEYEAEMYVYRILNNPHCMVSSMDGRTYAGRIEIGQLNSQALQRCFPSDRESITITLDDIDRNQIRKVSTQTAISGVSRTSTVPVQYTDGSKILQGWLTVEVEFQ